MTIAERKREVLKRVAESAASIGAVYFNADGNLTKDRKLAICGIELREDGQWHDVKVVSHDHD